LASPLAAPAQGSRPETMTAPDAPPLLDAGGLRRNVEGRTLFEGFALRLTAGERVAVTGPSGSGKTVLMRTLAGLEPPAAGEIRFLGLPLATWHMPEYRSRVMLLAQRPSLPEGTVEDALRAPFAFRVHRGRRYASALALAFLERVDRGRSFLERRTETLSGGEAQIAALLRVLLLEPQVLLLDEPTASLDAAARGAVEALVAAWLDRPAGPRQGRGYLWTSHDEAQVARVSDRRLALGAP